MSSITAATSRGQRATPTGNAPVAGTSGKLREDIECYRCGDTGHFSDDCPVKDDADLAGTETAHATVASDADGNNAPLLMGSATCTSRSRANRSTSCEWMVARTALATSIKRDL